jgi:hypothetical protein
MSVTVAELLRTLAEVVGAAGPDETVEVSARVGKWVLTLTSGGGPAPAALAAPAAAVPSVPWHSDDWRRASWPDLGMFEFTAMQGAALRVLWEARAAGRPCVNQLELLRAAGSDMTRLCHLFRGHPAWQQLILSGPGGTYRLPPVPAPVSSTATVTPGSSSS